jgi:hypothetical protein
MNKPLRSVSSRTRSGLKRLATRDFRIVVRLDARHLALSDSSGQAITFRPGFLGYFPSQPGPPAISSTMHGNSIRSNFRPQCCVDPFDRIERRNWCPDTPSAETGCSNMIERRRWKCPKCGSKCAELVRILDRDLRAAGIPKRDERGWTVDVHTLRHSFGTLLSRGGVTPRTAQAAMRHSTIDLTMNVYTDPKLLDVHAALDALPLDAHGHESLPAKATGTDDFNARQLAPVLAPTSGKSGQSRSIGVQPDRRAVERLNPRSSVATACAVKEKNPLTTRVKGFCEVERKGVEPSTSALRTQRSPN